MPGIGGESTVKRNAHDAQTKPAKPFDANRLVVDEKCPNARNIKNHEISVTNLFEAGGSETQPS